MTVKVENNNDVYSEYGKMSARQQVIEVWSGGYLATGMEGVASGPHYHGAAFAKDLRGAVKILIDRAEKEGNAGHSLDADELTWWGCTLYDNRGDAQRHFDENFGREVDKARPVTLKDIKAIEERQAAIEEKLDRLLALAVEVAR